MKKNEGENCEHILSEFLSSESESDEFCKPLDNSTDILTIPFDSTQEEEGFPELPVQPIDVHNFQIGLWSGDFIKLTF